MVHCHPIPKSSFAANTCLWRSIYSFLLHHASVLDSTKIFLEMQCPKPHAAAESGIVPSLHLISKTPVVILFFFSFSVGLYVNFTASLLSKASSYTNITSHTMLSSLFSLFDLKKIIVCVGFFGCLDMLQIFLFG